MRSAVICFTLLSAFAFAAVGQNASNISGAVEIEITGFDVSSSAWAENFNWCLLSRANLSGTHDIRDGGTGVVASATLRYSRYDGTISAATIYEHCYQAIVQASCDCTGDSNAFHSATQCAPPKPNPPDSDPITLCDDGSYTGQCSPIVIQLRPGAYALSGPDDPVEFDIDANGTRDRITWTARGSALAFLAMDRNGNSTIDDGAELFGTATRLRSGLRAPNGFEALRELDSNGDAIVDARDAHWGALLLWADVNHDGIAQPYERESVAGSAVEGIETRYHWTGRRDAHGNVFGYQGMAHLAGTRWPIYDVYFRSVP